MNRPDGRRFAGLKFAANRGARFGPSLARNEEGAAEAQPLRLIGAPDTNRTYDLPLRRGPLYPLSYRGA